MASSSPNRSCNARRLPPACRYCTANVSCSIEGVTHCFVMPVRRLNRWNNCVTKLSGSAVVTKNIPHQEHFSQRNAQFMRRSSVQRNNRFTIASEIPQDRSFLTKSFCGHTLIFSPSRACSCFARMARETSLPLETPAFVVPLSAARRRSAGSVRWTRDQRAQAVPGGLAVLLLPAKSGWHRYRAAWTGRSASW